MSELRLAPNLVIDTYALTIEGKRFATVGKPGFGKSNSLKILGRELILAGWTLAVIDPGNDFRQLRDAGLPLIVAGPRKSADVPLTNTAALAEFSFRNRVSVALDTSMVEDDDVMPLVQRFLQRLWQLIRAQDEDGPFTPYALFIDEAQMFIPQDGKTPVSGLIKDMAKRGRKLHLSMAVSTQRAASVQKDYLTLANFQLYHKMLGVDLDYLKTDLAISRKEAGILMRKFVKGDAVIVADSDLLDMGEEDYLVRHIDQFGSASAPGAVVDVTGARTLDAALLDTLREALGQPDTGEDMEYARLAAKLVQERDQARNELWIANTRIEELVAENQRLLAQQVNPFREAMENTRVLVTENGGQTFHDALAVDDYKSPLATQRGINRQRREFDALMSDIRKQPPHHRKILAYLIVRENLPPFTVQHLARYVGYSTSTIKQTPPTGLMHLGLIKRTGKRSGDFQYSSGARESLLSRFPDLDTDELIEQIAKVR